MSVTIGILAGMGPRSTSPFIDMLIHACQEQYGALYDMDFPEMHIISLPTPFWPGREINHDEMTTALQRGITQLKQAGVGLIAVPCNLAHGYFAQMQEACTGIPLLHIADSSIAALPADIKKVTLIATEPTLEAGFYQSRLQEVGAEVINTSDMRFLTTALVSAIKEKGFADTQVHKIWDTLVSALESSGAEASLIACTDITPLTARYTGPVLMVDTAKSLAEATIRSYTRLVNLPGVR